MTGRNRQPRRRRRRELGHMPLRGRAAACPASTVGGCLGRLARAGEGVLRLGLRTEAPMRASWISGLFLSHTATAPAPAIPDASRAAIEIIGDGRPRARRNETAPASPEVDTGARPSPLDLSIPSPFRPRSPVTTAIAGWHCAQRQHLYLHFQRMDQSGWSSAIRHPRLFDRPIAERDAQRVPSKPDRQDERLEYNLCLAVASGRTGAALHRPCVGERALRQRR